MRGKISNFTLTLIFMISLIYALLHAGILNSDTIHTASSIVTIIVSISTVAFYIWDHYALDKKHISIPIQGTQSAEQMINAYLDGKIKEFETEEKLFVQLSGHIDTEYIVDSNTFDDIHQAVEYFNGRFALIGDPGAGKSTTLKDLMRHAIHDYKANPSQARLPLWINLGLSTNPPTANELIAYWWTNHAYLPNTYNQYLKQNNLALFLDGLNEMPDQGGVKSRKARVDSIRSFMIDFPDVPTIVTSRIGDYKIINKQDKETTQTAKEKQTIYQELDKSKLDVTLQVVIIRELDLPRIQQMIVKRGTDEGLLQKIEASDPQSSLRRMAANPYNLTMLIEVYERDKEIPANFSQLYGRYVRQAYERNKNRKQYGEKLTDLVRLDWHSLERALKRLAYLMIIKGKGTSAEYIWAQKQVGRLALQDGINVGVLIETGGSIRFYHQSLQGFFGVELLSKALKRRKRSRFDVLTPDPVNLIRQIGDLREGGAPAVDVLIDLLDNDKTVEVRVVCIESLGKINDSRAINSLIIALEDENISVKKSALQALSSIDAPHIIDDPHIIKLLIKMSKDPNVDIRIASLQLLGNLHDPLVTVPLITALKDKEINVKRIALRALNSTDDPRIIEPIIALSTDPYVDIRVEATQLLGNLDDPRVIDALLTALKDKEIRVQKSVLQSLIKLGAPSAHQEIFNVLNDKDIEFNNDIIDLAMKLKTPYSINIIKFIALNAKHRSVRRNAVQILGQIGDTSITDSIVITLRDKAVSVRRSAAKSLGIIGDPSAIKPLITALNDLNNDVRLSAAKALRKFDTPEARQALKDAGL